MILDIAASVATLLPNHALGPSPSVIRIFTTRPVFLLFSEGHAFPVYVVHVGRRGELEKSHDVMNRLSDRLPGIVPRSLVLSQLDGLWAQVQEGMPGAPWFRLRSNVRGISAWEACRDRGLQTLRALQSAIRREPDWRVEMALGDELRREHDRLKAAGIEVSVRVSSLIRTLALGMDALGRRPCWFQHGDFCFNNLLVGRATMAVIDFEEFGATATPLHDEFSLAFSMREMTATEARGPSLGECVRACVSSAQDENPWLRGRLEGLLVYHLLWRINQCAERPSRAAIRRRLLHSLETLASTRSPDGGDESLLCTLNSSTF